MEFFKTILESTADFIKNIPNFIGSFFEIVTDTIDLIPSPFSAIIKVLLTIATAVVIVKTINKLK